MTPQEREQEALADLKAAGDAIADIARMLGLQELCAFDLETTGDLVEFDRVCEIAAVKVRVLGDDTAEQKHYIRETYYALVNPGIPIAEGATEKHQITNEMVAGKAPFKTHAASFAAFIAATPLFGYNITGFDVKMLAREFRIAGIVYVDPPHVIDPFRVYQVLNPRDLTSYVKHTLGEDLEDAHQAGADVLAVTRAFHAHLRRDEQIPRTPEGLALLCHPPRPDFIDKAGKFRWRNGEAIIAFSKNAGTPLRQLETGMLRWILDPSKGFDADTLQIARDALRGVYPKPRVPAATT